MSTALFSGNVIPETPARDDMKFDIVTADWNSDITHALRYGALFTFERAGIPKENVRMWSVPGTVELVNIAAKLARPEYESDGVIVIGCVIRGDTPHFDYVCEHTTNGVAIINAKGDTPVIFGVLTVNTLEQAQERAGGMLGNKGAEAAATAVAMANLREKLK